MEDNLPIGLNDFFFLYLTLKESESFRPCFG